MTGADSLLLGALVLFVGAVGLSLWAGVTSRLWPVFVAVPAGVASAALVVQSTVVGA